MNKFKFITGDCVCDNEQHTVIVNKCKIGDFIFIIENDEITKKRVDEISVIFNSFGVRSFFKTNDLKIYNENEFYLTIDEIPIHDLTEVQLKEKQPTKLTKYNIEPDDDIPF